MKSLNLLFMSIISWLSLYSYNKDKSDTKNENLTDYHLNNQSISARIGQERYHTYPSENKYCNENLGVTPTFIEVSNKTNCKSKWSADDKTFTYNKISPSITLLSFSIVQNIFYHVHTCQYKAELKFIKQNEFTMNYSIFIRSIRNCLSNINL